MILVLTSGFLNMGEVIHAPSSIAFDYQLLKQRCISCNFEAWKVLEYATDLQNQYTKYDI